MKISSLLGILAGFFVIFFAVTTSSKSVQIFLDPHGILVVFGGTIAAGLICFPFRFYARVGGVFINKFLGSYGTRHDRVIREIVDLAHGLRNDPDYLKTRVNSIKTPFLKDAFQLLVQGGIPESALEEIIVKRALTHSKRFDHDVNVFRTIAKFPPAFGLMGTTLGMISLLQHLGEADAQKMLGPAMAIGLVATFYGIVLANLVFIPIAENLAMINREDDTVRAIIIDGFRLIHRREHPKIVEAHLKSYLLPEEREKINRHIGDEV
jgi:chemotaxis protein MotA